MGRGHRTDVAKTSVSGSHEDDRNDIAFVAPSAGIVAGTAAAVVGFIVLSLTLMTT